MPPRAGDRIRVLIVDDSRVVQRLIARELSGEEDIEVVGAANDVYEAREMIASLRPNVLTLDVHLPRMDGLSFLEKLMRHYPLPVVVLSSLTRKNSEEAVRALSLGAYEVIHKATGPESLESLGASLLNAIRGAFRARVRRFRGPDNDTDETVIAPAAQHFDQTLMHSAVVGIGASTGGPQALEEMFGALPAQSPAILVVQHMPGDFTAAFARRLNKNAAIEVREAMDGDEVVPGLALIAPGDSHLRVVSAEGSGLGLIARLDDSPPVNRHRPSVDVLFHSLARHVGADGIGVLLTGMRRDGAEGLMAMRAAGAYTIGQDERSSVVYGMPRAAAERGACIKSLPLAEIVDTLFSRLRRYSEAPGGG